MKLAIAFGLLLAAIRIWIGFSVPPESFSLVQVFKDVAHLFMGGLFVAWYIQRQSWQFWLFWWLNILEVVVATLSRF